MGHSHHNHSHSHGPSVEALSNEGQRKRVLLVMIVTGVYMIVEFVGGYLANSLALIGDATHMLTDVGALALTYFSFQISRLPASKTHSYGFYRAEILGAFLNGIFLSALAFGIIYQSIIRIQVPQPVNGSSLLWISALGLAVNVVSGLLLFKSSHNNLAIRGALLHIVGDALGSVGAIIAAILILVFGWNVADPIVSIVVSLIILVTSLAFIKDTALVMLQATPKNVDIGHIQKDLAQISGVQMVHHIHIWSLTPGRVILTAHVIRSDEPNPCLLRDIKHVLKEHFGISHSTIQIESAGDDDACSVDR